MKIFLLLVFLFHIFFMFENIYADSNDPSSIENSKKENSQQTNYPLKLTSLPPGVNIPENGVIYEIQGGNKLQINVLNHTVTFELKENLFIQNNHSSISGSKGNSLKLIDDQEVIYPVALKVNKNVLEGVIKFKKFINSPYIWVEHSFCYQFDVKDVSIYFYINDEFSGYYITFYNDKKWSYHQLNKELIDYYNKKRIKGETCMIINETLYTYEVHSEKSFITLKTFPQKKHLITLKLSSDIIDPKATGKWLFVFNDGTQKSYFIELDTNSSVNLPEGKYMTRMPIIKLSDNSIHGTLLGKIARDPIHLSKDTTFELGEKMKLHAELKEIKDNTYQVTDLFFQGQYIDYLSVNPTEQKDSHPKIYLVAEKTRHLLKVMTPG